MRVKSGDVRSVLQNGGYPKCREKNAEFRASNIVLRKAISSQDWRDYGALKKLENNLKKMSVWSVYYCRNSVFGPS
jgi:hypothetical protein